MVHGYVQKTLISCASEHGSKFSLNKYRVLVFLKIPEWQISYRAWTQTRLYDKLSTFPLLNVHEDTAHLLQLYPASSQPRGARRRNIWVTWWCWPWQRGRWSQLPRSYPVITIPLTLLWDTQMLIFHALSYSVDPVRSLGVNRSDIKLKPLFCFQTVRLKRAQPCSTHLSRQPVASCMSFVQSEVIN